MAQSVELLRRRKRHIQRALFNCVICWSPDVVEYPRHHGKYLARCARHLDFDTLDPQCLLCWRYLSVVAMSDICGNCSRLTPLVREAVGLGAVPLGGTAE